MTAALRPQQVRLLDELRAVVNAKSVSHLRTMVAAPTGFGKTIVASTLAHEIQAAGKRAIFTVPALSLIDQTVEKFYAEGVRDVGVIQAMHPLTNYARPIQIASVQTLQRREIPPADLVMIDEAHLWFDFYGEWLKDLAWAHVPFVGLSATPWTRGLGTYFDKLIVAATTSELIDAGYLSKFRVFAPASPDLTGVRTVAGDYHDDDLSAAMDKANLVADVVDTWISRGQRRPTLCFAVDRAHAKHLEMQFESGGVAAGYIDAYTPAAERREIAEHFHAGRIKVVCNVGCLTTGIDWDVRCIILARPTKSQMLFVQMIGRGLRTADGKDDCLILDHSDNHIRLGFVTDIHHDELDDGRERQKAQAQQAEVLPKKCPKCSFLKPPKLLACPCCGFTPVVQNKVVHRDGELIEFRSRTAVVPPSVSDWQTFYCELKRIAETKGYKAGWCAYKFRERFGHFPPRDLHRFPSIAPSPTTIRWVQSRAIAYAKARQGAA
jgi:DNA repair protein RadD